MKSPGAALKDSVPKSYNKDILRILACGSVDDGKSTLIGRLLYETRSLFDDELAVLVRDSRKRGMPEGDLDFSLLVDGLEAEREQGITIDVAYRFFTAGKRKFILADTPGHEEYTANMATGASTADLAIILVDGVKGLLVQTKRHSMIVSLMGVRHVILAVNKIDLTCYSQEIFDRVVLEYNAFAKQFGFETLNAIPISARFGDNITRRSRNTPWYRGSTLIECLKSIDVRKDPDKRAFRMPVQLVNRQNDNFRGYAGTIASGSIAIGEEITALPSNRNSAISSIFRGGYAVKVAVAGEAVTVTLATEIDISRGDVISSSSNLPSVSDHFSAHLLWMSDREMLPARNYLIKTGTRTVTGTFTEIKYKVDIASGQRLAAKTLGLNEIAVANLSVQEPIVFEPYEENRTLGSFIVIDRVSNLTVGAGTIDFGLHRAANIHRQTVNISKEARSAMKAQRPVLLWFTGLSGAGKSTIANLVETHLASLSKHTYLLDGDNIRHGLNRDLGFTVADRVENIRRVGEVSKLLVDAGLIVLASFISPFRAERDMVRSLMDAGEFVEIYVDTPLTVAEKRDTKGLYRRARNGEIKNFTGIDSPYEPPENPDLVLAGGEREATELAEEVIEYMTRRDFLS